MRQVLIRHVVAGRVLFALPATVVEHTDARLVTWVAPRTPIAYPNGLAGGRLRPVGEWEIEERPWFGHGVVDLTPLGRGHMIRHFRDDDGSFRGWYVNLQAPLRPSPLGFDTMDHQLDLWIEPDGAVTWKDEDHLEQAVTLGILGAGKAAEVRREAERVLEEWPFPTGWEEWRPDPSWPLPALPARWDVPSREVCSEPFL